MRHVVVAGAGVAAVECVLALRELAGPRVSVELLAPAAELVHRPSSVKTPYGGAPAARLDLSSLAADLGIRLHRSALASVEPASHRLLTRDGDSVPYDLLVVATGVRWLLPLYELALLSAASLRERGVADPDIVVATGEHEPLEVFGPAASEAVRLRSRAPASSS